MDSKLSIKPHFGSILTALALLALFIVSAPFIIIFVSAFFMFDRNCSEDSRPVALMRSLSQEQLSDLNSRITALSQQYPHTQLTNDGNPSIPADLRYLKAHYIDFGVSNPYIVLAKCNVSVGISLDFDSTKAGQDTITLTWYAPTEQSPYGVGSEILWTGD